MRGSDKINELPCSIDRLAEPLDNLYGFRTYEDVVRFDIKEGRVQREWFVLESGELCFQTFDTDQDWVKRAGQKLRAGEKPPLSLESGSVDPMTEVQQMVDPHQSTQLHPATHDAISSNKVAADDLDTTKMTSQSESR